MAVHHLEPSNETLHGTFWSEWEPILTIDPGDTVILKTLDAGGSRINGPSEGGWAKHWQARDPRMARGHALVGPIAIRGAQPGQNLVIDIGELRVGSWGWTYAGGMVNGLHEHFGLGEEQVTLNWTMDRETNRATNQFGQSVAMAPFFGVMGLPGTDLEPIPSWPARVNGGNLDCKELVNGTRLYLPIAAEGALFSAGDGHAAQGDGESSGTAIECPFDAAELTFTLNDTFSLIAPIARTPDSWITFGFGKELNGASLQAVNGMLDLFEREFRISRANAMALISVAVDLRVTQIVNGVRGVHAVLYDDAIDGL